MKDERTTGDLSQEISTHPEEAPAEGLTECSSGDFGLKIGAAKLALAAGFGTTYGWLQHRTAQELAANRKEDNVVLPLSST